MDIQKVRQENLRSAVKIAGSMTKLAERADSSTSYLSQCLSEKINKPIGPSVARRVEKALGFNKGWMDTPSNLNEDAAPAEAAIVNLNVLIDQLDEDEKDDLTEYIYMMIRKRKLVEKYK